MRRLLLFVFQLPTLVLAQEGVITGTIRNVNIQEPLIGVSVLLAGTQLGTVSAETGRYRLDGVPIGSYTVQSAYLRYQP